MAGSLNTKQSLLFLVLGLALGTGAGWLVAPMLHSPPTPFSVLIESQPPGAFVFFGGGPVSISDGSPAETPLSLTQVVTDKPFEVQLRLPGFESKTVLISGAQDRVLVELSASSSGR